MRVFCLVLVFSLNLFAQERSPALGEAVEAKGGSMQWKIQTLLKEIRCRTNETNERKFMFLGGESYAVEYDHQIENKYDFFLSREDRSEHPDDYLAKKGKVYVGRSTDGDIFVIEKRKKHRRVFAYICEREDKIENLSSVKLHIKRLKGSRSCKLKEAHAKLEVNFFEANKYKTLKYNIMPINYSGIDQVTENEDFPFSLCKRDTDTYHTKKPWIVRFNEKLDRFHNSMNNTRYYYDGNRWRAIRW
jgi:hypothetical protein